MPAVADMLPESKGLLLLEGLRGARLSALLGVFCGHEVSAAGLQCFCETVAQGALVVQPLDV